MSTGLENDLLEGDSFYGYASEEEMYEAIQSGELNIGAEMTGNYNEAMGYESNAPRPQDYQSQGDYDAALAEWYANTPADSLERDADKQLWAVQAYNAGDLSAEEAQGMWDEAFYSRWGGEQQDSLTGSVGVSVDENGSVVHSYDSEGFTRGTSTYDRIVFGEDDTSTYDAYAETTMQQNESFSRGFLGGFQDMVASMSNTPAGMLMLGLMTGGAASSLVGAMLPGLSATASAALSGALSQAANQLLRGDEFDLGAIVQSAALSGLSTAAVNELKEALADPDSFLNEFFEKDFSNEYISPDGTVYTHDQVLEGVADGSLNPLEVADWEYTYVDSVDDILVNDGVADAIGGAAGGIIDAIGGDGGPGTPGGDTESTVITDNVNPSESETETEEPGESEEQQEEAEEVEDTPEEELPPPSVEAGDATGGVGGDGGEIDDTTEDELVNFPDVTPNTDEDVEEEYEDLDEDEILDGPTVDDIFEEPLVETDETYDDGEDDDPEIIVPVSPPEEPTSAPASSGGMLGGAFEPKVTDLFAYTKLTPYQKQALEPLKQQISTAKGMLS